MRLRIALAFALALSSGSAPATVGYWQHGYGLKAKGMGGVGIALPQDSLAAAANPAGMALVGSRFDAGLEFFQADAGSEIAGNTAGLNGNRDAGGAFLIPEGGYNRALDERRTFGVSVYGNGGVTRYRENPFGGGGTTPAGFRFIQGVVAPTWAKKLGAHALGASLNLVYQQFEARGLQRFDNGGFSSSPGNVTNRGWDRSFGIGFRAGWIGQIAPALSVGAMFQPKTRMARFDRYKGLFADQGSFDVPATYGAGIAWQPGRWTLAADLQRVDFSKVAALGNRSDCFLANTCLLGTSGGPGAGWRDVTVLKLGAAYDVNAHWTVRGGIARLRQPIPEGQTLFNLAAPAISENHVTLGATWKLRPRSELTFAFMRALPNTVHGRNSIGPGIQGGGEANLRMSQTSFGASFGVLLP